jgi:N-methylhydantoinase A
VEIMRYADLHYHKQAFELTLPVAGIGDSLPDLDQIVADFHAEHKRTYGHMAENDPVGLVNIRVIGRVAAHSDKAVDPDLLVAPRGDAGRTPGERMAYFGPENGLLATPVMVRSDLVGRTLEGPLIIEEYDSTCVIPPGCHATVDGSANIDIRMGT